MRRKYYLINRLLGDVLLINSNMKSAEYEAFEVWSVSKKYIFYCNGKLMANDKCHRKVYDSRRQPVTRGYCNSPLQHRDKPWNEVL